MDLDTHGSVVILVGTSRKHLCRRSPAHSWTPIIPKIKKTKKQSRRTFPNIGRVSSSNMTKIRIPEKGNGKNDTNRAFDSWQKI